MNSDLMDTPDIHEHHGLPWRAKPGHTSTFDEFRNAREHIVEIWHETDWNRWLKAELAAQLQRAMDVDDEWKCADPDRKPLTKRQIGARMAAITRKVKKDSEARQARWDSDKSRYDPEGEKARWALRERQASQPHRQKGVDDLRSGARYPGMPADRRAREVEELEKSLQKNAAEIARLSVIVGDPEDVVDEHGRLPRDRRTWNLNEYRYRRIQQVEALREAVSARK